MQDDMLTEIQVSQPNSYQAPWAPVHVVILRFDDVSICVMYIIVHSTEPLLRSECPWPRVDSSSSCGCHPGDAAQLKPGAPPLPALPWPMRSSSAQRLPHPENSCSKSWLMAGWLLDGCWLRPRDRIGHDTRAGSCQKWYQPSPGTKHIAGKHFYEGFMVLKNLCCWRVCDCLCHAACFVTASDFSDLSGVWIWTFIICVSQLERLHKMENWPQAELPPKIARETEGVLMKLFPTARW